MTAPPASPHDRAGLRPAGPGPEPARKAGPLVQYALLAGPLLSMLDSSIVNVAVEPIARELHASLAVVQWTVSGYLLALGAGLAGTAYLARRFGTLPVYRPALSRSPPPRRCARSPRPPGQLGDASTLFNTWQRIAGSFGIGLVAALLTPPGQAPS